MPDEPRADLTVTLALTVIDPDRGGPRDVLARGRAEQHVGELARQLAEYFGRPSTNDDTVAYSLRVQRTGEQLRPDALLASVDLLEGDTVSLIQLHR